MLIKILKSMFSLSLFFLCACSSDSSPSSNTFTQITDITKVRTGECKDPGTTLAKESVNDAEYVINTTMPSATINCNINSCDEPCELTIPDVNDYCSVDASIKYTIIEDTLSISYDRIESVSKCMCSSDHFFDIEHKLTGAKYILFKDKLYSVNIALSETYRKCH